MSSNRLIDESGHIRPISVNYFPHRKCNYSCTHCFHTEKNIKILTLAEAKRGLKLVAEAGMQKMTISGGEPFLQPQFIGEILKYCKMDLKVSTSIICNGSKVTLQWLHKYGQYLDIMGVSCDSFDDETNVKMGRTENGRGGHANKIFQVANWCRDLGIPIKINTVVNRHNVNEDMNDAIEDISPCRWKVFQMLLLEGENKGPGALRRSAENLVISKGEFQAFIDRHVSQHKGRLVPEPNELMENSYLNLDENMCFLNCAGGKKVPGKSILEPGVTVQMALKEAGFDANAFIERGAIYDWTRPRENQEDLEW